MDSNGPERRSTNTGSPRSTEVKFTAPKPGLKNLFFYQGNGFRDVVRALARYMALQDSTAGAMAAATVKKNIFDKPKKPTVRQSAEYLEELEAYFDKEDEWAAKVRA